MSGIMPVLCVELVFLRYAHVSRETKMCEKRIIHWRWVEWGLLCVFLIRLFYRSLWSRAVGLFCRSIFERLLQCRQPVFGLFCRSLWSHTVGHLVCSWPSNVVRLFKGSHLHTFLYVSFAGLFCRILLVIFIGLFFTFKRRSSFLWVPFTLLFVRLFCRSLLSRAVGHFLRSHFLRSIIKVYN